MKIDILCPHGSPLTVIPEDIYGRGVGGAELALMSLAEQFAKFGHSVTIYNDPRIAGIHQGVSYEPLRAWNHADERDVAILFRAPHYTFGAARGKRIFWSCDQYTVGNYATDVFPYVDKVVTISDFHAEYFKSQYQLPSHMLETIGLGVRAQDYNGQWPLRVPHRAIFCSVPGRGLEVLAAMWPKIVQLVPDASLTITSDYRLWGNGNPGNHEYRLMFAGLPNVDFRGKVSRAELTQLQRQAELQLYPCTYDELFCISTAECQAAGVVPITSTLGALPTTNIYGIKVPGAPATEEFQQEFVHKVFLLWVHPSDLLLTARELCLKSLQTDFNWEAIALQWETLFE